MFSARSLHRGRKLVGAVLLLLVLAAVAPAQVTNDQAADMLLDAGRRAYNEKNYPFAVQRFREFLQKFGGHANAPLARYGLALALLDGPDRDYAGVVDNLQPLANSKEMPEHPFVLYYLGLARRGLGVKELAQAIQKPNEATQRRQTANQRFDEAARDFTAAIAAFTAKAKEPDAEAKQLPVELEWAARARCDLAEMQLRTLKTKDAQATAAVFVKDPMLSKSRYRPQGLYYHGFASFLLADHQTAGRSLTITGVTADPIFGTHARYVLARVHHAENERAEAAVQYEGVLNDFAQQKQNAVNELKQPEKFKNDPEEKARLEAMVNAPPPDHVARATFYLGVMLYEDGKFADALARMTAFVQQFPQSPLLSDAQLRQGFCQVQLKQWAEAQKTLQPLTTKAPHLADQCLFWIARAQVGAAQEIANNPAGQDAALKQAIATFGTAADRAAQLVNADPEAKTRRGEILLERADTQQLAKLPRDAATTYTQILNDKLLPAREEELTDRLATALHLAGDYPASDQVCQRFVQTFPKSSLLPSVLFRHAENAYFVAVNAEKNPNLPNRAVELAKLNDEVIKRYQVVVDRFPEFAQVNLARYGVAMGQYRKGELEKAKETLEKIPAAERNGELAVVSYVLADCVLRLAPTKADDALEAGRLQEQLTAAIELLEGFLGANAASPQAPDALIKLGLSYQRMAALLADPQEKAKSLATARAAYERVTQQFAKHELMPQAVFERAKVLAQAGDVGGSINELRRFATQPELKNTTAAPMALLNLATLLRGQNKAAEAADVLAQARQTHEATLQKDPTRATWVHLLQYHHGVALREANKRPEARAVLNLVVSAAAGKPEGVEAALRYGQCLREEGMQKIDDARKKLATPNLKVEEVTAAKQLMDAGLKDLRDTVQFLEAQAETAKQKQAEFEGRARMHYEAAWCARTLGEFEVDAVRSKMQADAWQKLKDDVAKQTPAGRVPPVVPPPTVPLKSVPMQPSEQKTRDHYQALLTAFPDVDLAGDARLELAEVLSDREQYDEAIKLLKEGLDREPPLELGDKMRIRLGACLTSKGDPKSALNHFLLVAGNVKSPLCPQGLYRAGECLMTLGEHEKAVEHLKQFRDNGAFQNLPGLTDRALLRLGHAYGQLKNWDASRQAHEQSASRFPNGVWVDEARYGVAWALQNQQRYDEAVNWYLQVVNHTAAEVAARAQLQMGLCRMEQKRYPEAATALLVVPFTYDYPEWSAAALYEAHRTFTELKQPDQAERLLRRLIKDHPESKWAELAKTKLKDS